MGNCHLEYLGFGAYHEWFGEEFRKASPAVVRIRSARTYSLLRVLNDLIPHFMGTFTEEATLGLLLGFGDDASFTQGEETGMHLL